MFSMSVVRLSAVSVPGEVGYGRDDEEAHAHAGWLELPEDAVFEDLEIHDRPGDEASAAAAKSVCGYHIEEDTDVPEKVKQGLRDLIAAGKHASAVHDCMMLVWDGGFEEALPEDERKYT